MSALSVGSAKNKAGLRHSQKPANIHLLMPKRVRQSDLWQTGDPDNNRCITICIGALSIPEPKPHHQYPRSRYIYTTFPVNESALLDPARARPL